MQTWLLVPIKDQGFLVSAEVFSFVGSTARVSFGSFEKCKHCSFLHLHRWHQAGCSARHLDWFHTQYCHRSWVHLWQNPLLLHSPCYFCCHRLLIHCLNPAAGSVLELESYWNSAVSPPPQRRRQWTSTLFSKQREKILGWTVCVQITNLTTHYRFVKQCQMMQEGFLFVWVGFVSVYMGNCSLI